MPRLIWSPNALADVQRAYRFLALKDKDVAKRAARTIRNGVKAIGQCPEIGRPVKEMSLEFREWLINFGDSGYIAIYRYDGFNAVILAIRHQKESGYHSGI